MSKTLQGHRTKLNKTKTSKNDKSADSQQSQADNSYAVQYNHKSYPSKNFALQRSWPASSEAATLASSTSSERRSSFTRVDDTGGKTTVVLGLQQLWSDATSNMTPYYQLHVLYSKPESLKQSVWGGSSCGNRISDTNLLIVLVVWHMVERRSLTTELSLFCARPAADG